MNKETINAYFEKYEEKEEEIKAYDKAIKNLEQKKEEKIKELENYSKDKDISIPLNELLAEISKLTETPIDKITVNLNIPIIEIGSYTDKEEFVNELNAKNLFSVLEIYGEYVREEKLYKAFQLNCQFYYSLNMPCNLEELCTDGKKMKDKFELINFSSYYEDTKKYTKLSLKKDEDISTVICHIHLHDLANTIKKGFNHPNKLLKEAVLSYIDKEKETPKIKKLSK